MQFNRFIWSLYTNSEEGRRAIERELADHITANLTTRTLVPFKHQMFYCETANDEVVEGGVNGFDEVDLRELIREFAGGEDVDCLEAAEKLFIGIADEYVVWPYEQNGKTFDRVFGGGSANSAFYADLYGSIEGLSAGLHDAYPDFFVPLLAGVRMPPFSVMWGCRFCGVGRTYA